MPNKINKTDIFIKKLCKLLDQTNVEDCNIEYKIRPYTRYDTNDNYVNFNIDIDLPCKDYSIITKITKKNYYL